MEHRARLGTPHPLIPLPWGEGNNFFGRVTQGGGRPKNEAANGRPDPGLMSCRPVGAFGLARTSASDERLQAGWKCHTPGLSKRRPHRFWSGRFPKEWSV
jgi:hypothetical protein